ALNDVNTIDLGASTVSGNLSVTAAGPIMQSGAITANVVGKTATFAAGVGNNITLDGANDFTTVKITSGNDATLNDVNAINLGNSTVSGSLGVTAGGNITQTGALAVTGASTFDAGATHDITLANAGNSLSSVWITGKNVSLTNTGALSLNASTVFGALGVTAGGIITQTGPLMVTGAATFAAGSTNNIILADSNGFSSVGITSGKDVILSNAAALALSASTVSNSLTVAADGDLTLNGLINAGAGGVTLVSNTGAIINGMGSSRSITAASLVASAVEGIGSGNALRTGASMISATNDTLNNIEFENTGILTAGVFSNNGSGDVILNNYGAVTTGLVASSGGAVSITAHSPLTIGAGGVSANGNITLEASASGASDDLTINGMVSSSNGNIILKAGSSIILGAGGSLSAFGTITMTDQLNAPVVTVPPGSDQTVPAATGNEVSSNDTVVALKTTEGTTIATVETTSDSDEKEDEERKKKKEGGEQTTDDKKKEAKVKNYCN
ncbi:MAG: hypothetical protein NTW12_13195, partial [Deltaproteobacteria bacterium]|nr:hypothetical protein [Deltaproteobacteria bacterium]